MWGKATFDFLQQDFFWRQAILFSCMLYFANSFVALSYHTVYLYQFGSLGILLNTFLNFFIDAGILYVCLYGFMAKAPTKQSLMQVWAVAVGFGVVFLITQQILNLGITLIFLPAYFRETLERLFYFKAMLLFLIPFALIAFPLAYHFQNEAVYIRHHDETTNGKAVLVVIIVLITFYSNRNNIYVGYYLPHSFCLLFMIYFAIFFKPSK